MRAADNTHRHPLKRSRDAETPRGACVTPCENARVLVPASDFINLDGVTHLAAGGQSPVLNSTLGALERAAREVHAAAVAKAAAWPVWRAMTAAFDGEAARAEAEIRARLPRSAMFCAWSTNAAEVAFAGVRWWSAGEVVIVASPDYGRFAAPDADDLALGIARALAEVTREGWRVVVESATGERIGSASSAAEVPEHVPDEGARWSALAKLCAQGWDDDGREIVGPGAALARRLVQKGNEVTA